MLFARSMRLKKVIFYAFFGSLDIVKQTIWLKFFDNAVTTIEKEAAFENYLDKDKLLTLCFTLFEVLTLNRSYVLFSLKENKEGLKNLKNLKLFRNHFKEYIVNKIKSKPSEPFGKVAKVTEPVFSEGAWLQFLFILKFWMDDTSKGFEKTDVLIEKSVNTVVDLLDTKPWKVCLIWANFYGKKKCNK